VKINVTAEEIIQELRQQRNDFLDQLTVSQAAVRSLQKQIEELKQDDLSDQS